MSKQVSTTALRKYPVRLTGRLVLALLSLGMFASPAQAAGELTPHTAEYNVKISIVSGRLRTALRQTEAGYTAEHNIAATGMSRLVARGKISEASEFASGPDGLQPVAYRSTDTLSRDKVNADVQFDWDSNHAFGTVNGEDFKTELAGFSHDRVSIQYQLMHDLLNDDPSDQYRMFEVDKQKVLNIRMIEAKTVKVRAGKFEAIGIQHQAENSSRVTTLWCVEELGFLPVVIEQHRKGKLRVRATLRNYVPLEVDVRADEPASTGIDQLDQSN
ncbi:MAG: DUF3108 domain-containing protein [Woeseiaceae bacterium]